MRKWYVILGSCCVGVGSALAWAMWRPPTRLLFRVPDDFSGPFILLEDPAGLTLKRKWGRIVVSVPPSRVVRVQSPDPIDSEWRTIAAIRHDGTMLPYDGLPMSLDLTKPALRGFRFHRESNLGRDLQSFEFWIGAEADVRMMDFDALRRPKLGPPPTDATDG